MGPIRWGIPCCLLAGCMVQPVAPDPHVAAIVPVPPAATLRVGLEFLPPDPNAPAADVRVATAAPAFDVAPRRLAARPETAAPLPMSRKAEALARRHTWTLDPADLEAMADPLARETLRFVEDLVEEDRRTARREVRLPFFDWQQIDAATDPLLSSEHALEAAREEWIHEHGPKLLRRPLKNFLKRLPAARQFEIDVEDFRSDHVPLSEPYQVAHEGQGLGRVSMRLRASDWHDPLEVVYIRDGVRIGSNQTRARLSWNLPLSDSVTFELRASRYHDDGDYRLRGDLVYRHSAATSVHLSAGDDLDFLSSSSIFSLFESPMAGEAGVVLYAVHVF